MARKHCVVAGEQAKRRQVGANNFSPEQSPALAPRSYPLPRYPLDTRPDTPRSSGAKIPCEPTNTSSGSLPHCTHWLIHPNFCPSHFRPDSPPDLVQTTRSLEYVRHIPPKFWFERNLISMQNVKNSSSWNFACSDSLKISIVICPQQFRLWCDPLQRFV